MATKSPLFFFSSSAVCPRLATPLLSVNFLVFHYFLTFLLCLATMLPASFASKPDSSPASGLEVLRRNIAAIDSTLTPPAAGSSLRRAYVLVQDMGEGMLSNLSGQASGKWSVCLSRLLIFANAHGLRGGWGLGGHHCHGMPRFPWR